MREIRSLPHVKVFLKAQPGGTVKGIPPHSSAGRDFRSKQRRQACDNNISRQESVSKCLSYPYHPSGYSLRGRVCGAKFFD